MIFKLRTSKKTMNQFEEINASLKLQPFILAKLAIAMSVRSGVPLTESDFHTNIDGLELNRQTITGEYDDLFKALIIDAESKPLTDEEYFPKYLKAHLDRGAALLYAEYQYSGSRFLEHLMQLEKSL